MSSVLQVLNPKGMYNGQVLTMLVKKKTTANTPNTIAMVPEIISMKYKVAITKAMINLIIRSAEPIFFFMIVWLGGEILNQQYNSRN